MVNGILPDGWEWKSLNDICLIKYGKNLPTSKFIDQGFPVFGANGIIGYYDTYLYEEEQVLISCRGAYSGKINFSPAKCYITNNSLVLELARDINKKFIYYALQIVDKTKLVTGTAQPQVTINNANVVQVPLAPLDEQERIVNRIEELLSDLDAGVAALKRVRAGLERYQNSVLNAAIFGKLVKQIDSEGTATELLESILENRKTIPARNKNPLSPDFSNVSSTPSLPNSWAWATLDQLTWSVRDGMHFSPEYVEEGEGVPFITGGNVRPTGVDFKKAKRISHELHNKLMRFKPDKGDILYTKGGTTGIARVNTYDIEFNVWVHVAVLKLCKNIDPFYIQHALNSPFCYQQSQKYTHGVGNQDLGLTRMIKILIPLPPLDEQRRIVAEVERRLSVVGEVESAVEVGLVRAGRLRQSVLRSAFEGRL